jgi:hypothetical protein
MKERTFALLLALFLAGCASATCAHPAARCSPEGNPQACDSRGRWQDVNDCARLSEMDEGTWTCQRSLDVFACLPEVSEEGSE